jgi:hypothetical protein
MLRARLLSCVQGFNPFSLALQCFHQPIKIIPDSSGLSPE